MKARKSRTRTLSKWMAVLLSGGLLIPLQGCKGMQGLVTFLGLLGTLMGGATAPVTAGGGGPGMGMGGAGMPTMPAGNFLPAPQVGGSTNTQSPVRNLGGTPTGIGTGKGGPMQGVQTVAGRPSISETELRNGFVPQNPIMTR